MRSECGDATDVRTTHRAAPPAPALRRQAIGDGTLCVATANCVFKTEWGMCVPAAVSVMDDAEVRASAHAAARKCARPCSRMQLRRGRPTTHPTFPTPRVPA